MKIDRTYIISLPHRLTDRLIPLIDYLKSIDLDYSVFSAIKNDNGALGLINTIEKLLTQCVIEDMKCILVLEDDANFIGDNIKSKIESCIEQLPENFDCLYLGVNLFEDNVGLFSPNLIKIKRGYSSHAIIYSNFGMKKVLKAIAENKKLPLDLIIVKEVQQDGNCYCSFPMLVSQKNGWSDIEKKEINYDNFLVNRFNEQTKHL